MNIDQEIQKELNKMKEALEESEGRYLSLFNNNYLAMLIINPNTTYIENANPAACRYYGYTQEQLKTIKISDINMLNEKQMKKEMQKAWEEKRSKFDFPHRLANGELREVEVYSGPIRIKGKELLYSIILDITDQKKAERDIIQSNIELNQILNSVTDYMRVIDLNFNVIRVNTKFVDLIGEDKKQIIGKKCYEVFPGPNCFTQDCTLEKIKNGIKNVEYEVDKVNKKEKVSKPYLISANPLCNSEGDIIGMVQSYKDLTDLKKNELHIKESEKRYRSLYELSPDAIIVYTHDLQVLFVNPSSLEVLGVNKAEELIGQNLTSYIHPDYVERAKEKINFILLEGRTRKAESYKIVQPGGKVIDIEARSAYISFDGVSAIQTVVRDITDRRKELEKAAKIQMQRLKTEFPIPKKAELEIIYKPKEIVGGDLFHFYKLDENNVIGFLGDVTGKGLTAALSSSAVKVLFYEIVSSIKEPINILNILNNEVKKYLEDEYLAASCFKFDFQNRVFTIAGAGINTFSYKHNGYFCFEDIVKGPFLGMLENTDFEEKNYKFTSGDVFYLYTDGFQEILYSSDLNKISKEVYSLKAQKQYFEEFLSRNDLLQDDATLLAIEVK